MEHFPEIEKMIVRVICDERGTAFLISDRWLLTAEHVVAGDNDDPEGKITIEIPDLYDKELSLKAEIVDVDKSLDIALLQLPEPLEGVHGLKLVSAQIPYNEHWETFGYPAAKLNAGARYRGQVRRSQIHNEACIWDLDLLPDEGIEDADALSGSPVIIDGVVQGIFLVQLEGTLGAISIEKIRGFLDKNGIQYETAPDSDALPEGLKEVAKQSLPNHPVIEGLEQQIIQTRRGYLLVKGSPGAGKTTLTASYTPNSREIEICGKYFVRNDLDNIPVSYRASEFALAEWLDANIHRVLHNAVPDKKERQTHDWIDHLSKGLRALSTHYAGKNQIGVFFIDGVDDVHRLGKTTAFFSLLPEQLPDNVVVVISCQTEEVLPSHLQVQFSSGRVIKVVPLSGELSRHYITTRTVGLQLPLTLIESISEKSEGHPLYLRYLAEYAKQLRDVQEIENWIQEVPAFGGEIGNYYESIWQTVRQHHHETWMLATVARLRNGIDRPALERMLPAEARYAFFSVFPKIQHLLVNDEIISMYHSSFAMFIDEKTIEIKERVHRAIAQFCNDNREHSYAVKNILFHMLNADEEMRKESVLYCNQEWADRCARGHVEPDVILEDLKQVLDAAITFGDISTVTSLLLLSQRISFRYNNIFAEYAAELARTLIAMGRPKEAVRYIIRESVLIVSGSDALYFLHRLYEAGEEEEAEQLFKAIHMRFVYEMDRGAVAYGTMGMYYAAWSIKTGMFSEDPGYEFSNRLRFLLELLKQNESDDDDDDYKLIDDIVAYNKAYLLWRRGIYVPIKHIEERGTSFGNGIVRVLSKMLIHLKHFQALGNFSVERAQYNEFLQDIEYVIGRYGIDEDDMTLILNSLTDVSFNENIIEKLIDEVRGITQTKFSLRKSNGVDLDFEAITNYLDAWRYKGFLDEHDNYPAIAHFGTPNWELYFEEILSFVGYMLGKAWRALSLKQDDRFENVSAALEKYLLPKLIVPLKERVNWDRSYALPESFYPYLFTEIASFYVTYRVDQLPVFVQVVESRSSDQLGLYTEGFRQAMFSIITEMMKTKKHVKSTFGLLKIVEEHITRGVQNRWERARDLLQVAELYARLGSEPRSKTAFQRMLDTSMGPSWYKEDQLTLLETSISHLQRSDELSAHLKEIAGHYDFASGEMTFQRYVRQVKEAFIGSMCTMGRVTQAVGYFKNTFLPTPEKVLQFAESDQIDSPEVGKGYVFGAGGLNEQSCILEILENAPNVKGLLKWAFCELFLIGDDRYFDRFTRIMADLLNERETSGSDELPVLYRRLLRIMISDMSPDNRTELLSHLKKWLSDSNYNSIVSLLQKAGLSLEKEESESGWESTSVRDTDSDVMQDEDSSDEEDDDRLYLPGTFGKMSAMKQLGQQMLLAKDQLDMENDHLAKQHFIEGLEGVQAGAWNIWTSMSGAEVIAAFEMLSSLSNTKEFVQSLHSLIMNEVYAGDWIIVNKLISSIGKNLDSNDATRVFNAVLEHTRFMLRTPDDAITKYEWFEQETRDVSNNILLTDLFIWLFGHPKSTIKHRAPEIIKGLTKVDASFFVPMLINKSLSEETSVSPEICAGILHSLAIEDASLVWEYIRMGETQKRIVQLDHFMIKHTFLEIAALAGKEYGDAVEFNKALSETFSIDRAKDLLDSRSDQGVDMPYWLNPFSSLLKPLEQLGLLGSTDYQELVNRIDQLCLPLSVEELIRVDRYVNRSYRSKQKYEQLETVVRTGINQLLSMKVDHEQLPQVADILRIYNPFFPNEGLRLISKPSLLTLIEELVSENGDAEACTQDGAYDYLHYFEMILCPNERQLKVVEIIGFLVGPNAFQSRFNPDDLYEVFFSNEQPSFQDTSSTAPMMYRPAIYKVEPVAGLSGGIMTPAFLHPQLEEILGEVRERDITRESWLDGRDWDVDRIGIPLREGCRLLISKEKTRRLSLTSWRLVWLVRYDFTTSFIIDRDNRAIYRFE